MDTPELFSNLLINCAQADELLSRMLASPVVDRLSESEHDAFSDMWGMVNFSPKQLLWIQGVAIRLELLEEPAQNGWSSLTPAEQARIRGREVPTPAVLLNRPLAPPGRAPKESPK